MGSYAIVGAHLPIALGRPGRRSTASRARSRSASSATATTNIGAFHEALNMAAVWKAPVVFVCENNQYMEYTPIGDVTAVARPAADRASAYGLEPIVVDGNDVEAVYAVATRGRRARPGRRRTVPDRGAHLPARRPLAGRSRQVPARRRGRGVEGARPDPVVPGAARGSRRRRSELDAIEDEAARGRSPPPRPRRAAAPEPDRRRARDPGLGRRGLGMAELTYRGGDRGRHRPGDGARPERSS